MNLAKLREWQIRRRLIKRLDLSFECHQYVQERCWEVLGQPQQVMEQLIREEHEVRGA